jgi:hypothetical protein
MTTPTFLADLTERVIKIIAISFCVLVVINISIFKQTLTQGRKG